MTRSDVKTSIPVFYHACLRRGKVLPSSKVISLECSRLRQDILLYIILRPKHGGPQVSESQPDTSKNSQVWNWPSGCYRSKHEEIALYSLFLNKLYFAKAISVKYLFFIFQVDGKNTALVNLDLIWKYCSFTEFRLQLVFSLNFLCSP